MDNRGGAPNGFERDQGKALRVCQVPYGQCKISLNGVVDRYLDTNDILGFHMSKDLKNNLPLFQLS